MRQWSGPGAPGPSSAEGAWPEADPEPDGPAAAEDGATGAVGLGYRVVEEYLEQGRRAAEAFGQAAAAAPGVDGSFQMLSARLLRDALAWVEHVARITSSPAQEAPRSAPAPAAGAAELRIRVASSAPVEVELQLRPGTEARPLAVQDLRAPRPELPPLTGVRIARETHWQVELRVPDEQPHGLYAGVVYDPHDGTVCGTLAVRVGSGGHPS